MRILITGSNGLLGQKLVELLRQQPDVALIATSRGPNKLAEVYPDLYFLPLDVSNWEEVEAVLAQEQPTHLIHTAAMTNVDECELNQEDCWRHNVTATEHLVTVCATHKVHLTHVSTDFVFSGEEGPLAEDAVPAPINFYGKSKLAAEQAVQASPGSWAIVRTVLVYGTAHNYGRTNIVLWVRDSLRAGKHIKVVSDQYRTPTLAEDLAIGCWLVARQNATGVYHISSSEMLTPYQMALQVADYFKLDQSLITKVDASTFTQPAKRPPRTGFIIGKAQQQLGFQPRNFQAGIALLARQTKPF